MLFMHLTALKEVCSVLPQWAPGVKFGVRGSALIGPAISLLRFKCFLVICLSSGEVPWKKGIYSGQALQIAMDELL